MLQVSPYKPDFSSTTFFLYWLCQWKTLEANWKSRSLEKKSRSTLLCIYFLWLAELVWQYFTPAVVIHASSSSRFKILIFPTLAERACRASFQLQDTSASQSVLTLLRDSSAWLIGAFPLKPLCFKNSRLFPLIFRCYGWCPFECLGWKPGHCLR